MNGESVDDGKGENKHWGIFTERIIDPPIISRSLTAARFVSPDEILFIATCGLAGVARVRQTGIAAPPETDVHAEERALHVPASSHPRRVCALYHPRSFPLPTLFALAAAAVLAPLAARPRRRL